MPVSYKDSGVDVERGYKAVLFLSTLKCSLYILVIFKVPTTVCPSFTMFLLV